MSLVGGVSRWCFPERPRYAAMVFFSLFIRQYGTGGENNASKSLLGRENSAYTCEFRCDAVFPRSNIDTFGLRSRIDTVNKGGAPGKTRVHHPQFLRKQWGTEGDAHVFYRMHHFYLLYSV